MSSPLKSMAESAASRFDQAANAFKKPKVSEKDSLVTKFEEILDLKLKPIEDKLDKIDPLTQQISALNVRMSTMETNLQDQADQAVFIGMQKMHIPQQLTAMQEKLGQIEQSLGQAKDDIIDLKVGDDDDMNGIDKIAEHDHELFLLKNELEKLSMQGTSAVTQHKPIDLSKARKIRDAVAVRDKMSLIVKQSLEGVAPELVVDQILGDGVRKDTGMKVEKEVVPAGDKYKIKLQFPTKDARNTFLNKYFPRGGNKMRSSTLKFKDDEVWFTCPQPEWQTELFDPLWKLKDVYEARGSSSSQPLKLFVDFKREWLVDASDSAKVYAKIVNGHVEETELGKSC